MQSLILKSPVGLQWWICNPKPLFLSPPLSPTGVYRLCHLIFATISHMGLSWFPVSTERLMAQRGWKLKLALLDVVKEVDGAVLEKLELPWCRLEPCHLIKCCLSAPCIHSFPLLMTKNATGGKKVVLALLSYWENSVLNVTAVKSLWVSTRVSYISFFPS